jgi:hypothetical protein
VAGIAQAGLTAVGRRLAGGEFSETGGATAKKLGFDVSHFDFYDKSVCLAGQRLQNRKAPPIATRHAVVEPNTFVDQRADLDEMDDGFCLITIVTKLMWVICSVLSVICPAATWPCIRR